MVRVECLESRGLSSFRTGGHSAGGRGVCSHCIVFAMTVGEPDYEPVWRAESGRRYKTEGEKGVRKRKQQRGWKEKKGQDTFNLEG